MHPARVHAARTRLMSVTSLAASCSIAVVLLAHAAAPIAGPNADWTTDPSLDLVQPRTTAVAAPAQPIVVYREDFENAMGTAATGAKSLTANALSAAQYTGASGMTYTADTNWREGQRCSGIVLAFANGDSTRDDGGGPNWATTGRTVNTQTMAKKCSPVSGVQSYNGVRTLARAMGQVVGGGDGNHMVSTYTECDQTATGGTASCDVLPTGPTTSRMFETQQQVAVTPNHYYTFAVDAVAGNCSGTGTTAQASDPRYQFQLLSGTNRTDVGSALNPCRDATRTSFTVNRPRLIGSSSTMSGYVSRLRADSAFMYAGTTLGVAMYNQAGVTNGNDGGFDNVEVRDVTPTVDKSFSPALIQPGTSTTLTFTITNTSDLLAKSDWGFVDTLPAGLSLASSSFGGTCTSVTGTPLSRSGTVGGSTITVTGADLSAGQTSCTITASVTSVTEGTYTNSPTGNMALTGLVPGSPATVELRYPRLTLMKALASSRVRGADQFSVAIRTGSPTGSVVSSQATSTTTGTGSTVSAGTGTTGAYIASAGTTYYLTESGAGATDLTRYDATLTCTDSTGRTSGLPSGAPYPAVNTVVPAVGSNVSCTITNRAKAPTILLRKSLGSARAADTDEFTVSIRTGSATGTVVSSTAAATTTGAGATVDAGTGTTGLSTATAGTSYHLTEQAAGTADLSVYDKRITCADVAGVQAGLPDDAVFTDALIVTPVAGAEISCVLTNTLLRRDIYLRKQAQQPDGSWAAASGSSWELHADAGGAMGAVITSPSPQPVSGQTGQFKVAGLAPGSYWLLETRSPSGTTLLAQPIRFTVGADGTISLGAGASPGVVTLSTSGGVPELLIRNQTAGKLPSAGGPGAAGVAALGLAALLLAVLLCFALGIRGARRAGVSVRP